MTTIPTLNMVIQQGDTVRESLNIKNQALDTVQHSAFQRLEEEDKKRTVVSQAEETEKILFNKENSGEGNRKHEARSHKKKQDSSPTEKSVDPDAPGRLLDTIV